MKNLDLVVNFYSISRGFFLKLALNIRNKKELLNTRTVKMVLDTFIIDLKIRK